MEDLLIRIASFIGILVVVITALNRATPHPDKEKQAFLNKLLKFLSFIAASYSKGDPNFWKRPLKSEPPLKEEVIKEEKEKEENGA